MPTIHDLKESKYLSREDVSPPILVTISGYAYVNLAKEGQPKEEKYVINFNECEKPLVLNSTNGQLIAQITGSEDFDNWIGRQVVLFFDPTVSFGGQLRGGIRIRAPKIKAATGPTHVTAATAPKFREPARPAPAPVQPDLGAADTDDEVPF